MIAYDIIDYNNALADDCFIYSIINSTNFVEANIIADKLISGLHI